MQNSSVPFVIVFLKYPVPGKVKTRLADGIGAIAAADLYRDWIGLVLINLQADRPTIRIVGYFDGGTVEQFAPWFPLVDDWVTQPAGDLGERLAFAFEWGHARGSPVLAVGTDCLELNSTHITDAITRLNDHDAVFGPATDGGYYLVGSSRLVVGFFLGIRWSSSSTLADHLVRCERLGLSVCQLDELADIDTADDWLAYQQRKGDCR